MKEAPVRNIISHSLVDGPGNRTSVFLQGCPIRCGYCHNPETQELARKDKPVAGSKWMNTQEVYDVIKNDVPFIRGITVSGGEAMIHAEFLEELFTKCQDLNITTLIDSSGVIDFEKYPKLLEVTTGVMLDVKAWDEEVFRKLTLSSNKNVQKNLKYLSDLDKIEELRVVCIPNEVDVEAVLRGIKETIQEKVKTTTLYLIKFRHHGVTNEKFKQIPIPSDEYMEEMRQLAIELGFEQIKI